MPTPRPRLLFVYGSLRRGEPMFTRLGLDAALDYVGDAFISADLYEVEDYPGAVPGSGSVWGELYRIKDEAVLERLDGYEEFDPQNPHESLFERRPIDIPGAGLAWVYFYNRDPRNLRKIGSGDWRRRTSAA